MSLSVSIKKRLCQKREIRTCRHNNNYNVQYFAQSTVVNIYVLQDIDYLNPQPPDHKSFALSTEFLRAAKVDT